MQSLKLNAASRELQEFVISEFPRNLKHNCKILESLCITWQILGIHISGFLFKAWLRLKAAIGVLSSDTVAYSSSPTMASSDSQRTLSLTLNAVSRELDTVNHQSRARIIQMSRSLGCPRWHCRPLAHQAAVLPCGHVYHHHCLVQGWEAWKVRHGASDADVQGLPCPICLNKMDSRMQRAPRDTDQAG